MVFGLHLLLGYNVVKIKTRTDELHTYTTIYFQLPRRKIPLPATHFLGLRKSRANFKQRRPESKEMARNNMSICFPFSKSYPCNRQ
jgi:hypothetical protein